MAKLLLVEDDNNLREIYEARLSAEGYEIVTAQNGEEALVVAKQQHPDLIISDVMMPRISGFEMLDILRNTDELRDTKVIMLTALGQAEDQERAGKLGADKYLVKSQVTLEDIVNSAKALLESTTATASAQESENVAPVAPVEAAASFVAAPSVETPATFQEPSIPAPTPPTPEPSPVPPPTPQPDDTTASLLSDAGAAVTVPDPDPIVATTAVPSDDVPVAPAVQPLAAVADTPSPPAEAPTPVAFSSTEPNETPTTATAEASTVAPSEAPQVAVPAPAAPSDQVDATATNDATLARAVDQLNGDDEQVEPEIIAAMVEPEVETANQSAGVAEAVEPAVSTSPETDHVDVVGKKVIQPLNDAAATPNLEALLAKEEANEQGSTEAAPRPIVVGGSTPAVTANTEPQLDPNSIAL